MCLVFVLVLYFIGYRAPWNYIENCFRASIENGGGMVVCITMYNYFQASIENGGGMVVYNYGKWTTLASARISEDSKHIRDLVLWCITMYCGA